MGKIIIGHDKHIKDPVWTCVQKALEERLKNLEINGPKEELDLAKKRYTGLTYKDVSIEPATLVKDDKVVVCIAVRKTGFARVDVEIEKQDILDVFKTFNVLVRNTSTVDEFKSFLDKEVTKPGYLINRIDTDQLVILLPSTENLKENIIELLGDIFFSKITWDEFSSLVEFYSGDLTINDPSIEDTVIKVTSQKDYNESINKFTVDSKVVSLANGKMTANIYLLDKDGNKVTPTDWVVNDPNKSTDLISTQTTQEIIEDGQCMVVSWEYNTDALTDRTYMAQGSMNVDGGMYSYNITHVAPKVLRLSGAVKQLNETEAKITLTYDSEQGTIDVDKAYTIKGDELEGEEATAGNIDSSLLGTVSFVGPYAYDPNNGALRYFTGHVILKNELDRQVAFNTFNSPTWRYKLLPPSDGHTVVLTEIDNTYDDITKLASYKVGYNFQPNDEDVLNPGVSIVTKVGGEVVDCEIIDKDLSQNQLLSFSVKYENPENNDQPLETTVTFSFPEYLGVPDTSITMATEVKQLAMEVEVSDLKLGVLTVKGTHPKAQDDKWSYENIDGVGFELNPISAEVVDGVYVLQLQLKSNAPVKSNISGVLVNGTDKISFQKEIERKTIFFNQYSGYTRNTSTAFADLGLPGDKSLANNIINAPTAKLEYTEGGEKKTFDSEVKSGSAIDAETYRMTLTCPQFSEYARVVTKLWVDDKTIPNSSTYVDCFFEGLVPLPEGATGIIAEPESLDATDVKFQYAGKIKFFFNDPAKTPVVDPLISGDVELNGAPWNYVGMYATETGYDLKFNRLDETVVDTLFVRGKCAANGYMSRPEILFEQRYGYTGGNQLVTEWDNMVKSSVNGTFRVIDEKGNTTYVNEWEVKGFEPGIWGGTGPLKIRKIQKGLLGETSLSAHINTVNKPDSAATNIVILADGVEYTSRTEFDYIPVDPGEVSVVYDKERNLGVWTVKLPEDGITSDKLVVQRDYTYGEAAGGSNTFNWIRDAKIIDEKTVTFTTYVANKSSTNYEVWFSNADVKCSSHSVRTTLVIEP